MSGPARHAPHSMPMSKPMIGIGLLYLSAWFLCLLDASGKWIMAVGVPLFFMLWARFLVHFLIVAVLLVPTRGWKAFKSHQPAMQLLRGLVMFLGTITFFSCLHYLPQAEATSIAFMSPLIMLLMAPWLLGEPMHKSRWVAAIFGFIGVLIIIRPSSGLNMTGVVFGLITAVLFAAMHTLSRKIASDHPYTSILWSGAVGSVVLTLILPFIWESSREVLSELTEWQWMVMISLGFSGALGHLLQISAYRNAPASLLAPFIYLQITAAATIGWLIWGHFPDGITWIGIGIICCSGIGIGWLEWRRTSRNAVLKSVG